MKWVIPHCASSRALAERHKVSLRTAQRWLKSGRVEGAFRAREGWWVPTKELKEAIGDAAWHRDIHTWLHSEAS